RAGIAPDRAGGGCALPGRAAGGGCAMSGLPLLPLILITAVALAWARLLWRHRQAPGPIGRLALLLLLQPVCAGLLYLTLAPSRIPVQSGTLSVLTAGADPARATGAVVV